MLAETAPDWQLPLTPAVRSDARVNRSGTSPNRIAHVRNAHEAAGRQVLRDRQITADCAARRTWQEGRLPRKLSFICAAQQNGVDPLSPVRGRPAIGRSVTGTVIPRLGNSASRMPRMIVAANWRFHTEPTSATELTRGETGTKLGLSSFLFSPRIILSGLGNSESL